MQNFDVIATAKEAAAKCEPITSLLEVISIDENSGIFGLGSEGKNENKMVVDRLHRHGYLTIQLPEKLTSLILELEQLCMDSLWSIDLATKKKIGNVFKKSKAFNNRFSYSYLPSPGKESWKIRTINSNEKVMIPEIPNCALILQKSYEIANEMHSIILSFLNTISISLGLGNTNYFNDLAEPCLHCNDSFPHGLSTLLLLNYFDTSKPTPVESHTDQHLFTLIPLNTKSPALQVYDFVDQKWHFVEENNEAPFTRAVLFGGETLSKLTNDYFTSCLHKVVGIKASPNDIPNRGPSRFSVPYMVAAKKGALLDTSLEPNYNLLFKNDSNVTENENAKNDAPIEVGDFLWQCTLAYAQENEQSIMKRYDIKKQSKPL